MVRPRVTRQPVVEHVVQVEGLLVELFVEGRNLSLVDDAELFSIFKNLTCQARIPLSLLIDYARERKTSAKDLLKSINPEFFINSGLIDFGVLSD